MTSPIQPRPTLPPIPPGPPLSTGAGGAFEGQGGTLSSEGEGGF